MNCVMRTVQTRTLFIETTLQKNQFGKVILQYLRAVNVLWRFADKITKYPHLSSITLAIFEKKIQLLLCCFNIFDACFLNFIKISGKLKEKSVLSLLICIQFYNIFCYFRSRLLQDLCRDIYAYPVGLASKSLKGFHIQYILHYNVRPY